ncbi:hypothetical protein [Streptomyces profundus]|nr:hypothetical protein [Streptomyces sp. MA3_2.13]UED86521.1 hypothetical protein K4G22_21930 [Streptomyces sp. MA3_2.13]
MTRHADQVRVAVERVVVRARPAWRWSFDRPVVRELGLQRALAARQFR